MYVEDAELFAFRLLQKWWNACELDDDEAKNELGEALKSSQLAGLARNFLGLQDNNKGTNDIIFTFLNNLLTRSFKAVLTINCGKLKQCSN